MNLKSVNNTVREPLKQIHIHQRHIQKSKACSLATHRSGSVNQRELTKQGFATTSLCPEGDFQSSNKLQ